MVGFGTVGDTQAVRLSNIKSDKTNSFAILVPISCKSGLGSLRIMIGRSSCEITEQTDQRYAIFSTRTDGQLACFRIVVAVK